jgi:parvulin-like peptidyl-prolyl isomerase
MKDFSKIVIETEEIINFLKSEMSYKEVCERILYQRVISQTARERGITVTAEEIEAEANRQRRERGLEKATDTVLWLAEQFITPHDWEVGIQNRLLAQKLAEVLFTQDVEKFFVQNRLEFEQVILYQIVVANEKLAQELYYQIEEGEISFYDAAHLHDIDSDRKHKCGYEGKIYRWLLQPKIAAVVFNTPQNQLMGPLKTEQGFHILMVEEFIPADLTTQRYEEILNKMFKHWLATELDYMLLS